VAAVTERRVGKHRRTSLLSAYKLAYKLFRNRVAGCTTRTATGITGAHAPARQAKLVIPPHSPLRSARSRHKSECRLAGQTPDHHLDFPVNLRRLVLAGGKEARPKGRGGEKGKRENKSAIISAGCMYISAAPLSFSFLFRFFVPFLRGECQLHTWSIQWLRMKKIRKIRPDKCTAFRRALMPAMNPLLC
jgi:hypothetical protein